MKYCNSFSVSLCPQCVPLPLLICWPVCFDAAHKRLFSVNLLNIKSTSVAFLSVHVSCSCLLMFLSDHMHFLPCSVYLAFVCTPRIAERGSTILVPAQFFPVIPEWPFVIRAYLVFWNLKIWVRKGDVSFPNKVLCEVLCVWTLLVACESSWGTGFNPLLLSILFTLYVYYPHRPDWERE